MDRIPYREERLAQTKMMFQELRLLSRAYLGKENIYTSDLAAFLLGTAIVISTLESRPMTPHKLAQFTGIPRATVVRRLKGMTDQGLVEMHNGKASIPMAILCAPRVVAAAEERMRLLDITYRKVFKLDN